MIKTQLSRRKFLTLLVVTTGLAAAPSAWLWQERSHLPFETWGAQDAAFSNLEELFFFLQ